MAFELKGDACSYVSSRNVRCSTGIRKLVFIGERAINVVPIAFFLVGRRVSAPEIFSLFLTRKRDFFAEVEMVGSNDV